jgi:hypothetical protein
MPGLSGALFLAKILCDVFQLAGVVKDAWEGEGDAFFRAFVVLWVFYVVTGVYCVVVGWVRLLAVFSVILVVILLVLPPVVSLVAAPCAAAVPGSVPGVFEALVVLPGPVDLVAFFQVFLIATVVDVLHKGWVEGTDGGFKVVGEWCRGVGDPGPGALRLPPSLGGGNVLCGDRPSGI